MKGRGYDYATPMDALEDKRWQTPKATQPEILTAEADLECKRQNKVVDVWFSVESAMQKAAIDQNAQELNQIKAGDTKVLQIVASVLGSVPGH